MVPWHIDVQARNANVEAYINPNPNHNTHGDPNPNPHPAFLTRTKSPIRPMMVILLSERYQCRSICPVTRHILRILSFSHTILVKLTAGIAKGGGTIFFFFFFLGGGGAQGPNRALRNEHFFNLKRGVFVFVFVFWNGANAPSPVPPTLHIVMYCISYLYYSSNRSSRIAEGGRSAPDEFCKTFSFLFPSFFCLESICLTHTINVILVTCERKLRSPSFLLFLHPKAAHEPGILQHRSMLL